jgi:hypothetical protein
MNAGTILSILVSTGIGFLTLSLFWPRREEHSRAELALRIALSWGFGQGLTSCMLFLYLLVNGRADRFYVPAELLVCLSLAVVVLFSRRKSGAFRERPHTSERPVMAAGLRRLLASAFYIAIAASVVVIAVKLSRNPSGEWDAWAIWNLRARWIARSGYEWRESFSSVIEWSHPDYPLLLPLTVVRGWLYAGAETTSVPMLYAWLFAASTIAVIAGAIATMRSPAQAYLAGLVLVGFTFFAEQATWQYADVPLMFFFLSALVLAALYVGHGAEVGRGWLILAGVAAGLSAWTKNEGMLFVLAFGAAHLIVALYQGGPRQYVRQISAVLAGLVPLLVVVFYFKMQLAPPSEMASAITSTTAIDKVLDIKRYKLVVRNIADQILLHKGYGINLTYVLLIYIVCIGFTRLSKRPAALGGILLILMASGYFFVYITTPHDLELHIRFSIDRLLLQLWPSFVFTFFMLAGMPDEVLDRVAIRERVA